MPKQESKTSEIIDTTVFSPSAFVAETPVASVEPAKPKAINGHCFNGPGAGQSNECFYCGRLRTYAEFAEIACLSEDEKLSWQREMDSRGRDCGGCQLGR